MKGFLKLLILVLIVGFALINYRIFSFDKGFSKRDMEDKSVTEVLSTVAGIKKVEFYEKTIKSDKYKYNVYIVTNNDSYLLSATQDDIDAFKLLGIFSKSIQPEKISPIPFYVEIIVGFIILVIPFGKKNKQENETEK